MRRAAVPAGRIERSILVLRGHKVLRDADLAMLCGVPTGGFDEAARRNLAWLPGDLMFPLTNQDLAALRSQIATLKAGRGQHRTWSVRTPLLPAARRSRATGGATPHTFRLQLWSRLKAVQDEYLYMLGCPSGFMTFYGRIAYFRHTVSEIVLRS